MFNVNIYKETLETMEKYGYVVQNQTHEIQIRNPFGEILVEILWLEPEKQILIMTKNNVIYANSMYIMFLKSEEGANVIIRYIDAEKFIEKILQVSVTE